MTSQGVSSCQGLKIRNLQWHSDGPHSWNCHNIMFLFSCFPFPLNSALTCTTDHFLSPVGMIRRDLSTFSFNAGCWMGYCPVTGVQVSSPCQPYNGIGFPGKVRWDKGSIGQLSAQQYCFLSQRVTAWKKTSCMPLFTRMREGLDEMCRCSIRSDSEVSQFF